MEGVFLEKKKKKTKRKREAMAVGQMAPLWCATHTTTKYLFRAQIIP